MDKTHWRCNRGLGEEDASDRRSLAEREAPSQTIMRGMTMLGVTLGGGAAPVTPVPGTRS